ncbi:hypothetical protein [Catellatospora chokoriensis]|uniref:MYXO-CTERM domain-containing protein n=1 Tax=Catellatospora chokoriensis TaxID=310353 RepID=A0A8J3K3Q8_9ACTN|nr:hypothetical protein [Catellatospora chokoriensis]GIF93494.1 hypothetical protein Cch02nite_69380 [Catellatospora chokoriensis]
MRSALRVAAGAVALVVAALTAPAPAHAEGVFVEVNPSTIQAGFQVAIRASCGDALNNAKVHSEAFGTVTVEPVNVYLIAAATVPENKKAGGYNVKLTCPSRQTATTTLWVVNHDSPSRGPNTGGGALAGDGGATLIGAGATAMGLGLGVLLLSRRRGRSPLTPA